MPPLDPTLRNELLAMAADDHDVRSELVASGELFDGYHPRMAIVHARNAALLEGIVDERGWPGRKLVGDDGAEAAWLVLQHAIAHPRLQRKCLLRLKTAAAAGDIPWSHVAFLDDRICCFEERPQRYGTQFDWDASGELSPLPLQDPHRVDEFRAGVGLGPLAERTEQLRREAAANGDEPPRDVEARRREKRAWARSVGWIRAAANARD